MRVLFASPSYPADATDWRGTFMRRLLDALARRPDIQLSVWAPPGNLAHGVIPIMSPEESAWLRGLMSAGGISHMLRTGKLKGLIAALKLLRMLGAAYRRHVAVDVYHINWLQCALPLPANGKPALITVLGNDLKLLRLPLVKHFLRRAMRHRRVAICPNAEWMAAPLSLTFGDVAEIAPVALGIDPTWYAIKREPHADKSIWLVVTRLTKDKLGPLFEWSEPLFRGQSRELHLIGPMQEVVAIPPWVHYHGPASPDQLAQHWFPRARGMVTLSRHSEGRPQVMLEAMAAGLPIIASSSPAHSSLVTDGRTGRLCNSSHSYGVAIEQLEEPATNQLCGAMAREWALREVGTWDDCAARYAHIYRRVLGTDTGHVLSDVPSPTNLSSVVETNR